MNSNQPLSSTVVASRLRETQTTIDTIDTTKMDEIIQILESCVGTDRTVFIAGNGGSATTASHWVCDLSKVILGDKPYDDGERLRIVSLADSLSLVTAIANDISFDRVFADQFENLAKPGDILIVLSYSGNSANILEVLQSARAMGIQSIGLLGRDGGKALPLSDTSLVINSDDCGIVEDAHLMIGHIITHYFKVKNNYAKL